ncbi:MAG: DNA repair protein RecN [Candidatus Berkiellales bacterium]
MLQHLFIKDLAVVAFVDMHFYTGMTVITGETGAGKSVLLDALGLALGERADNQLIRPGAQHAEIAATFDISALSAAVLWLANCELAGDDKEQCLIRRIIYANGRSRAFINGCPVTTQQLRLLGEHLVQIHGQHQHQRLLKSTEQLRLLDAFGQHDELVSQVKTAFKEWEKCQQKKQALLQSADTAQAQSDLLQYQITELEVLALAEDELEQLYQEHDQLAHAQSYIQSSEHALAWLINSEENNVSRGISQVLSLIKPYLEKSKTLANAHECLENARIQVEEAVAEINHFIHHLAINPSRLAEIERRLERIHEIARKHKVEPLKLYQHHQHLTEKAQHFLALEETLKEIDQSLQIIEKQYQQVAPQLSEMRRNTAVKLTQEITQCLQQLGMPGAIFTIDLNAHHDNHLHLNGNENIVFNVSANPGHPVQPLNKVASGGELSRISLALEMITSKYLDTPCLIFDEVDVGISGKIGTLVGKALYELGKSTQVICVTHLPQVAAFGNHHIQVTKTRFENSTLTEIQVLNDPQRIDEIARMLGGMDVTTQARAHAKQLLRHQETLTVA